MGSTHLPNSEVTVTTFSSWAETVPYLLDSIYFDQTLIKQDAILIKPNLVENLAPPITTPVGLCEALVVYLQKHFQKKIIIGEGNGSRDYDTHHCFNELGYTHLAQRYGIELVDLNEEELILKENPTCTRWPELYLPKLLDDVFLISVPVLKAHSMSQVTLTMKNMMGCPPPSHYQQGGFWKKSSFHQDLHGSIYDLNKYRTPDFTLLDATIGMAEAHLWGPHCWPPINKLAVSWDPVAIDSYGCSLLDINWQTVEHIKKANCNLGSADPTIIYK